MALYRVEYVACSEKFMNISFFQRVRDRWCHQRRVSVELLYNTHCHIYQLKLQYIVFTVLPLWYVTEIRIDPSSHY